MEVVPAIDLRGGRCVRLYQGDYARETVYSEDPVAMALHWQEIGAPRIHIVDLDGAASGTLQNLDVIGAIAGAVDVPLQAGGGIRSLESMERLLALGIQRVILGTIAVEEPSLVAEACRRFGTEAVIVGVDAREGVVSLRGWRDSSSITARGLLQRMEALGVERFIYTDISRDGTLTEPNFQAIEDMVGACKGAIVASGGVSTVEHLERLAALGVEGAIVGKALYEGALDLREAISRV
ncbi:MAG: 1-(5-phosphoribosyl)-5-[(5-phosphoribosylamino)methylideneamino]imidazole-4-carboxamide isomerase [Chloroflexi bacterium]|nr:1-(5-phosphoribosyl)-5-[(5-phosphoribosylamino)methylideneamino]imidazole-4-carboxamide isomerase [Chloroflexota bacterium]